MLSPSGTADGGRRSLRRVLTHSKGGEPKAAWHADRAGSEPPCLPRLSRDTGWGLAARGATGGRGVSVRGGVRSAAAPPLRHAQQQQLGRLVRAAVEALGVELAMREGA